MERLIPHIEHLLITKDYVIIPGLGGFVTYYQSAKITQKGITPPLHNVGFNSDMCNNDGLLALELLRAEKISYREANLLIEQEVEKIKSELNTHKKILIGKLGTLQLNKDDVLIFTPANKIDFLPKNLGLKEVYISERKKTEEKITISIPKKSIFRYAAVSLILVCILLASPKLGDTAQLDYAGFYFKSKPTRIEPVENIIEEKTVEIIKSDTTIVEAIVKDYHIVVACFSTGQQAKQYCDMLIEKQYGNVHVLPSKKTNRVIIESFSDEKKAVQYLREIRKSNLIFKDAWLYKHQQPID